MYGDNDLRPMLQDLIGNLSSVKYKIVNQDTFYSCMLAWKTMLAIKYKSTKQF